MSDRHVELLDTFARMERLTAGKNGSSMSTIKKEQPNALKKRGTTNIKLQEAVEKSRDVSHVAYGRREELPGEIEYLKEEVN